MAELISKIISWGIALSIMGVLPRATYYMAIKAAESHQRGLISLSKLNRQLQGPSFDTSALKPSRIDPDHYANFSRNFLSKANPTRKSWSLAD